MYNLQNIKRIAEYKKITIREIAVKCEIAENGLHKSIAKNSINIETLYKIADFLNVTISELIAEKHEFTLPVKITDGNEYILKRFEEVIEENGSLKEKLKSYELNSRESYTMSDVQTLKVAEKHAELKK